MTELSQRLTPEDVAAVAVQVARTVWRIVKFWAHEYQGLLSTRVPCLGSIKDQHISNLREQRDKAERSNNALRGVVTRLKNRGAK